MRRLNALSKFRNLLCLLLSIGAFISSTATAATPTWTQLAPTGGPPPARKEHSAILDPSTNQMIVFGGTASVSPPPDLNDVWSLTTSGSPWTSVTTAGSIPPRRTGHSAVYDATNSRMTIFGGGLGQSSPCANDVWVLSNANRVNGTPTWSQLNPSGTAPVPRIFHTAVYDQASNRMVVFGGNNCFSAGAQFYNDVWVLSNANGLGGTPTWSQLSPAGVSPPARENLSAVYDAGSNRMIVFGGYSFVVPGNNFFYNDVWVLSNANGLGGTPTWTQLSPAGTLISARAGHIAVYDPSSNRMIVFAGGTAGSLNDVWVLSNANGLTGTAAWTQLSVTGTLPAARGEHTGVYDAASNRMIVFGGVPDSGPPLNDTWVLTNANGSGIVPVTPPAVTTSSLPSGTLGIAYSQTLSASGGTPPYSNWAVSAGAPPPGLTLNASSALISGIPSSVTGSPFNFSVTVQDNVGNTSAAKALSITINAPTPSISNLSPNSATAGGTAFTLTLNGTGFVNGSTVQWNGSALSTSYVSATQVTATAPASLIASAGTASVTVLNPGGAISNAVTFVINTPTPSVSGLSPNSVTAGGPAFILTVTGSGYVSGSTVLWNGSSLTTTFVSATQLTATAPANLIASAGTASVTVLNPGAATSNAWTFTFIAPTPSISGLSPNSVTAGGPAFVLTVNGSGFMVGSTVQWNGSSLSTSYLSGNQLSASVPASLIVSQGSASVSVQNPGGGTSNAVTFTINPPTLSLSSVNPNSATAGGPAFTLVANGSGFLAVAGAAVLWNGSPLSTSYISGNQLSASVPASLIASQGSVSVSVQIPGGGTSNAVTFTINPPGSLTILTPSPLPNGALGVSYSQGLTATGGITPYKGWAIAARSLLPPGLSLTQGVLSGTGLLSGTPTSGGTFTFVLQVTDNSNAIATKQFTLTIIGDRKSVV